MNVALYLGYMGQKFTKCKRLAGGITLWERLDRAVADSEWISLFPGTKFIYLECGFSDHKPIIIHPDDIQI